MGDGEITMEDTEPKNTPLLDKATLHALIVKIVAARQALAIVRVMEEGQYLEKEDRRTLKAADQALLRILREIREEAS